MEEIKGLDKIEPEYERLRQHYTDEDARHVQLCLYLQRTIIALHRIAKAIVNLSGGDPPTADQVNVKE